MNKNTLLNLFACFSVMFVIAACIASFGFNAPLHIVLALIACAFICMKILFWHANTIVEDKGAMDE